MDAIAAPKRKKAKVEGDGVDIRHYKPQLDISDEASSQMLRRALSELRAMVTCVTDFSHAAAALFLGSPALVSGLQLLPPER